MRVLKRTYITIVNTVTHTADEMLANWIAFFGAEDETLKDVRPAPNPVPDQLAYLFPAALGSRYESCDPSPIKYEELEFEAKIQLQLKRDKSGGGCG